MVTAKKSRTVLENCLLKLPNKQKKKNVVLKKESGTNMKGGKEEIRINAF